MKSGVLVLIVVVAVALTAGMGKDPALRVVVNLPAGRLDLLSDDVAIASFMVAIGSAKFPTPTGNFAVTEITWNPWWMPPPSDWARDEKPIPPGADNPMGHVKMKFAPLYFLHGTPDTSSIGHAASHGCIRMLNADAVQLAQMIQGADSATGKPVGSTRIVRLQQPVPLSIIYDRFEVSDTFITIHPDPYRRGRIPWRDAIADLVQGDSTVALDSVRLRALLKLPANRRFTVTRASIVKE